MELELSSRPSHWSDARRVDHAAAKAPKLGSQRTSPSSTQGNTYGGRIAKGRRGPSRPERIEGRVGACEVDAAMESSSLSCRKRTS